MAKLKPLLNRFSGRGLRIYLAPQRVIVTALDGSKVADTIALPVVNADGRWHAPLAALKSRLQADGSEAGAVQASLAARVPVSFSLAGRWCHSLIAPWSDALLAEPGATRFLRLQLAAVYGDAAQGWTVTADDAPYGQPRLACGIDNELLLALQALCAELHYPCAAIEPVLATVCRQMPGAAPFAIAEQGRLTLAAPARGRIAAIHTQPCGAAWPLELECAWQRWSLRQPELDAEAGIGVVDLTGAPAMQLPQPMRAAVSPFGAPAMTSQPAEALCA
jgi:hypothetical protein